MSPQVLTNGTRQAENHQDYPRRDPNRENHGVASNRTNPGRWEEYAGVTCIPMPGSLSGVGAGLTFGLAGHRLIYFSDTTTINLPTCLFSHNDVKGDTTVFLVVNLVLPFFFLTVCRQSNLPLRGILGGVVHAQFLCPHIQPCGARGFCTLLDTEGRTRPVTGRRGNQGTHERGT